jgi:hypothetical protein
MLQIVASLTDNSRGVIYDCNMFIGSKGALHHFVIYLLVTPFISSPKQFFFQSVERVKQRRRFCAGAKPEPPRRKILIFFATKK